MNRAFSINTVLYSLAFVVVAFYFWFPLDWGLMDDSEYVIGIQKHLQAGWLQGTWNRILEHAAVDLRTGIFRPSFWWYTALAYQLPVRVAYFSRFVEYALLIFSAAVILKMSYQKYRPEVARLLLLMSLFAIFSIRSLYEGIAFFSLQEFTGLFFVMLGYFVYAMEKNDQLGIIRLLLVFFLIALGIGFKPPFVWLYFLFSIGLFVLEKRRVFSLVISLTGIGYFLFTIKLAQTGFYSQEIYQFSIERIILSSMSFAKHFAPIAVVLVSIFFLVFRTNFQIPKLLFTRVQWIGLQFLFAGAMYMATLLPRGIANNYGYYFGPPLFLLTLGTLLSSTIFLESFEFRFRPVLRLGVAVGAGVALFIFLFSTKTFVERNLAIDQFKKWARENDRENITLATNSYEVAFRLRDIYFLNFGEPWKGQIKNLTHNSPYPEGVTHYLVFSDQVEPRRSAMGELVWEKGSAQLVRIRQETP